MSGPLHREHITGLILCGGQGRRLEGADKGLLTLNGQTLAEHALERLRPQVHSVLISANRNGCAYRAMGVPVHADSEFIEAGPLGGFGAGLMQTTTPYLLSVPCDAAHFPHDLAEKLADSLVHHGAEIAMAASMEGSVVQLQPTFCLMGTQLRDDGFDNRP